MSAKSKKTPKQQAVEALRDLTGSRMSGASKIGESFTYFFDSTKLNKDYDKAGVLTACAALDLALESALMTRLIVFDQDGERAVFMNEGAPLKSMAAKATMAWALGMISSKVKSDFTVIREIRNTFAHSRLDISFDTPEVAACVEFINLDMKFLSTVHDMDSPRTKFYGALVDYTAALATLGSDRESSALYSAAVLQQI